LQIDELLRAILPGLDTLRLGGVERPSAAFLRGELAHAPRLRVLELCGSSSAGADQRHALALALATPGTYPTLADVRYPAQMGTYKTGRGANVREHEYENDGERELRAACAARSPPVWASVSHELKYEVEGAQRRAGFAAMAARRRW
jgi:hypothetical protein